MPRFCLWRYWRSGWARPTSGWRPRKTSKRFARSASSRRTPLCLQGTISSPMLLHSSFVPALRSRNFSRRNPPGSCLRKTCFAARNPSSGTSRDERDGVHHRFCQACGDIQAAGTAIRESGQVEADGRTIGDTMPLVFESANGFNPGELGRGVSVEYTMKGLTTFKVFGNYQTPPEFDIDNSPEAARSRTYGFAFEKVIGSRGLSGVQFQFAGGYTPLTLDGQVLPALRFQRYLVFANKTFLD